MCACVTDLFVYDEVKVFIIINFTRVRLSKRRKLGAVAQIAKSRLVVKHRDLNDKENSGQVGL